MGLILGFVLIACQSSNAVPTEMEQICASIESANNEALETLSAKLADLPSHHTTTEYFNVEGARRLLHVPYRFSSGSADILRKRLGRGNLYISPSECDEEESFQEIAVCYDRIRPPFLLIQNSAEVDENLNYDFASLSLGAGEITLMLTQQYPRLPSAEMNLDIEAIQQYYEHDQDKLSIAIVAWSEVPYFQVYSGGIIPGTEYSILRESILTPNDSVIASVRVVSDPQTSSHVCGFDARVSALYANHGFARANK